MANKTSSIDLPAPTKGRIPTQKDVCWRIITKNLQHRSPKRDMKSHQGPHLTRVLFLSSKNFVIPLPPHIPHNCTHPSKPQKTTLSPKAGWRRNSSTVAQMSLPPMLTLNSCKKELQTVFVSWQSQKKMIHVLFHF